MINHTETSILAWTSVRYVRKSDDSWFCNSHCISHSCCVLHRYGSQDIHRWKFSYYSTIYLFIFFLYMLQIKISLSKNFNFIIFSLFVVQIFVNDPSAGSPTETLLRLLLPLGDMVYLSFSMSPKGSPDHPVSVGATGGVYKGQGHNQCKMMTCTY